MESKLNFALILLLSLILSGCSNEKMEPVPDVPRGVPIMQQDDLIFYQLHCDNFQQLPLQSKRYAYHLYRACLAGREIAYDQIAPGGIELLRLVDKLARNRDRLDSCFVNQFLPYALKFWVFGGNYNRWTYQKLIPEFSFSELQTNIVRLANIDPNLTGSIDEEYLKPYLFDAGFRNRLVEKAGSNSVDAVFASAVNLYDRQLSLPDVEGHQSRYKLNGRLACADGQIVEEVYRAGAPDVPPGRMAGNIERMIGELEKAVSYAPSSAASALIELVKYFRTGDHSFYEKHLELWTNLNDSPVDFVFGFLDTDLDPLKERGIFTGMVMIEDRAVEGTIQSIDDPDIKTSQILCAVGSSGPICPVGYRLPDYDNFSERFPKRFLFTNVIETYTPEQTSALLQEFHAAVQSPQESPYILSPHQISRHAFIMPELEPVRNPMAGIKDIVIMYRGDFVGQMIEFSK